jgi:uncharacterized protein YndB with AHSA1/START domain
MSSFSVHAQGTTKASPRAVWALVADVTKYPEWGPWDSGGHEGSPAPGVGEVRALRRGRTTTVEKVLEFDRNRRLVYTVVKGIPVRNYRAEVVLAPVPSGTEVTWSATWDRSPRGWFVEKALRRFYPQMMAQLVAAADMSGTAQPQA